MSSHEPPNQKEANVAGLSSHQIRAATHSWQGDQPPTDVTVHRKHLEPWLAALLQAEHLNLLLGSGLTSAVCALSGAPSVDISGPPFACELGVAVNDSANESAKRCGRGTANLEDQIRAARELTLGLKVLGRAGEADPAGKRATQLLPVWEDALKGRLNTLLFSVLATERAIQHATTNDELLSNQIRRILGSFLLTFASRAASRERLHIFTTNYDRLIEYGCDLLGLRVLDRFVGGLRPVFRASRLGVDLHYNPPGIRGEPRYLEGVVRLTKLHGSVDWRQEKSSSGSPRIVRAPLPLGAQEDHPELRADPRDSLIVYPNPAKDIETLDYPYAELFRDFAAACCQPNAVLVTYGYGFGDDHINRVLRDMLTIPSTHLAIVSFDQAGGRVARFCADVGRDEQITLLMGNHFADLATLTANYLPKPAIDRTTWRMVELIGRRTPLSKAGADGSPGDSEEGGRP